MVNIWLVYGSWLCIMGIYGGFHSHGGTQNGWFTRENPIYRLMMTGGTPILGNLQMEFDKKMGFGWIYAMQNGKWW